MSDLLFVDMGAKPSTIKFQALSGDFAERPFYRSIHPQMGTVHLRE